MPGQLLPLRLLNSARVPSGAFAVLVRGFPLRLKYLALASASASAHAPGGGPSARSFSSRAARSVGGPRERPRVDFRAAGQGRSLVEDEAELSDWVSELRTDSLRLGLSSEDEDSGRDRSRNNRGRNRDSVRDRESLKSFREKGSSLKRGRESELEARRSRFGSRNRFGSDLEEEEEEEAEEEDFGGRKRRGRDGRGGISSRRGERDMESSYRRGRGPKKPAFDALREEDEDDVDNDGDDDDISGFEDDFFGDRDGRKGGGVKNVFAMDSSTELDGGDSAQPVMRTSEGQFDSYLSETR